MVIFKKKTQLKQYLSGLRQKGKMGFVPTMGALHEGHLQLIRQSIEENTSTSCSIFVNPAQFNDPQDFQKYPITIESDIRKLADAGCDVLFLPAVDEIYPEGLGGGKHYDLGQLEKVLEGSFRPGHFQGVCQVVDILLEIVEPYRLYLGQKDYQQCMVIRKMIELTGRQTEVRICETIRETDGLAMSSRNMRLTPAQRAIAPTIYAVLTAAKNSLASGDLEPLKANALSTLIEAGFRPDYFEFAHAGSLEILGHWNGTDPIVALVAAFLGEVRLIDNMILN